MTRVTRMVAVLLATVLSLTACASSGDDGGTPAPASTATTDTDATVTTSGESTPGTTTGGASASTTTPTTQTESDPRPDPDRPTAPDVSLELADGSTFVLSEEARPVFMVFWAEW